MPDIKSGPSVHLAKIIYPGGRKDSNPERASTASQVQVSARRKMEEVHSRTEEEVKGGAVTPWSSVLPLEASAGFSRRQRRERRRANLSSAPTLRHLPRPPRLHPAPGAPSHGRNAAADPSVRPGGGAVPPGHAARGLPAHPSGTAGPLRSRAAGRDRLTPASARKEPTRPDGPGWHLQLVFPDQGADRSLSRPPWGLLGRESTPARAGFRRRPRG